MKVINENVFKMPRKISAILESLYVCIAYKAFWICIIIIISLRWRANTQCTETKVFTWLQTKLCTIIPLQLSLFLAWTHYFFPNLFHLSKNFQPRPSLKRPPCSKAIVHFARGQLPYVIGFKMAAFKIFNKQFFEPLGKSIVYEEGIFVEWSKGLLC